MIQFIRSILIRIFGLQPTDEHIAKVCEALMPPTALNTHLTPDDIQRIKAAIYSVNQVRAILHEAVEIQEIINTPELSSWVRSIAYSLAGACAHCVAIITPLPDGDDARFAEEFKLQSETTWMERRGGFPNPDAEKN